MPAITRATVRLPCFALAAGIVLGAASSAPLDAADGRVDFNRDVRPILSDACWRCHGFDEGARQAGLRLDTREGALQSGDSGQPAVVPGEPHASELMARVAASDAETRMPPADSKKSLTTEQVAILRRWIEQGAEYSDHWAFQAPGVTAAPPASDGLNPIDAFVAARFPDQVDFAAEASRETLIRRVSFDLTGLPPSVEDLEAREESYEQLVDRLLASPHFGERMAVDWLDAARFADTNGYFGDKPRQMWLWRDWVIDAFNSNMPFDQFTIEQLAGDLLPEATVPQRIATGFNRNHMMNNETGIIDEEFRIEYVIDRVDATMTTWLGLTIACAQCHDHKYDPVTQRDYYGLFAFFNDVPEKGLIEVDNPEPLISVTTPEQDRQLALLSAALVEATDAYRKLEPELLARLRDWEAGAGQSLSEPPTSKVVLHAPLDQTTVSLAPDCDLPAVEAGVVGQAMRFEATRHVELDAGGFDPDQPWTIGFWMQADGPLACPLSLIEPEGDRRGIEFIWQKGRLQINLVSHWGVNLIEAWSRDGFGRKEWHHVSVRYDGSRKASGLSLLIDGVPAALEIHNDSLTGSLRCNEPLRIGRRDAGLGYYGLLDEVRIVQQAIADEDILAWQEGERIRGILATPPENRGAVEQQVLLDHFVERHADEASRAARRQLKQSETAEREFKASIPTTLVMQRMSDPRATHVLERGQYDKPGAVVEPAIPAAFSGLAPDMPANRLGFARWLVSDRSPLTARVAVNRLWRQCFGEGLVRTLNDFGVQGEPPTHPELLDWLAQRFRDSHWDVKSLLRLIVTSRTYRQQSEFCIVDGQIVDPQNRWLARGPSFRLSAEMIRDQALSASGLLSAKIGGPSVKPYQPPGLWEDVSYNAEETYVEDRGEDLWRRSLYTYQKRQAPPPALLAFDGTTREKCVVQRGRTNTPIQALIVLNDPTYVEAARVLAERVLHTSASDELRIELVFQRVLSRRPEPSERVLLVELLARQRARFAASPDDAAAVIAAGRAPLSPSLAAPELAAWTVVTHALFNLDEALTRR